jgi:hypothetical protein
MRSSFARIPSTVNLINLAHVSRSMATSCSSSGFSVSNSHPSFWRLDRSLSSERNKVSTVCWMVGPAPLLCCPSSRVREYIECDSSFTYYLSIQTIDRQRGLDGTHA